MKRLNQNSWPVFFLFVFLFWKWSVLFTKQNFIRDVAVTASKENEKGGEEGREQKEKKWGCTREQLAATSICSVPWILFRILRDVEEVKWHATHLTNGTVILCGHHAHVSNEAVPLSNESCVFHQCLLCPQSLLRFITFIQGREYHCFIHCCVPSTYSNWYANTYWIINW